MAVHSIFHVGFVVRDLDASIRFYTEGLGLRLRLRQTQDNDYTRSLVGYHDANLRVAQFLLPEGEPPASGHILELVEYVAPEGGPADLERNTIGAGHLAFLVDDIEAMTASLRRAGSDAAERAQRDHRRHQQGRQGPLPARPRRRHARAAPAREQARPRETSLPP